MTTLVEPISIFYCPVCGAVATHDVDEDGIEVLPYPGRFCTTCGADFSQCNPIDYDDVNHPYYLDLPATRERVKKLVEDAIFEVITAYENTTKSKEIG